MGRKTFEDWQFGEMQWNDDAKVYTSKFIWEEIEEMEVWLRCSEVELNDALEPSRKIFNYLKKNEDELKVKAAEEVFESFAETMRSDEDDIEDIVVMSNVVDLINEMVLCGVEVDCQSESSLTYMTGGGPLIRIFVSPALSYTHSLLD
jgi:hypothetical protein